MILTVMMACIAGWWFWWLYRRGVPHQISLEEVCEWVGAQYSVLRENPYVALFGSGAESRNPQLVLLRQQIQTALFAGHNLEPPLRDLYRTLRRFRLDLYARQQVLHLFCFHQLLLLGMGLVAKAVLVQKGFLPVVTDHRSEIAVLAVCLLAAGTLTAWMHTRMPPVWGWKEGWTALAHTWMTRLFQGEEESEPAVAAWILSHWVEEQFVQDEVAQKQFASAYPFYELGIYFLLLGGIFGQVLVEWGEKI